MTAPRHRSLCHAEPVPVFERRLFTSDLHEDQATSAERWLVENLAALTSSNEFVEYSGLSLGRYRRPLVERD